MGHRSHRVISHHLKWLRLVAGGQACYLLAQDLEPDAGDPHSSDSDGKGVWVTAGGCIKGKWVEVIANRASRKFTGRAEISYDVKVNADSNQPNTA